MIHLPTHKKIILFDGMCNLCNKSVLKVIQYDQNNNFVFCAIQSDAGEKIIQELQIDLLKIDSIILYDPVNTYTLKSTAVLQIMNTFGGLWNLTQIFWLIPAVFRNHFYDFIAKNRYQWFGKEAHCRVPTPELEEKFLTSFIPFKKTTSKK